MKIEEAESGKLYWIKLRKKRYPMGSYTQLMLVKGKAPYLECYTLSLDDEYDGRRKLEEPDEWEIVSELEEEPTVDLDEESSKIYNKAHDVQNEIEKVTGDSYTMIYGREHGDELYYHFSVNIEQHHDIKDLERMRREAFEILLKAYPDGMFSAEFL